MALFTVGTELKVHQASCTNARRIILELEPAVTALMEDDDDLLGGLLL